MQQPTVCGVEVEHEFNLNLIHVQTLKDFKYDRVYLTYAYYLLVTCDFVLNYNSFHGYTLYTGSNCCRFIVLLLY